MLDCSSMLEMPFEVPCSRWGAIPSVWCFALPDKGGKVPYERGATCRASGAKRLRGAMPYRDESVGCGASVVTEHSDGMSLLSLVL